MTLFLIRNTDNVIDNWEYKPVSVTGEFINDFEFHIVSQQQDSKEGIHIVVPFKLQNTE